MNSDDNTDNDSTFFSITGFIGGLLLSAIVVAYNYMTSPAAMSSETPFLT